MSRCRQHIAAALDFANKLTILADEGEASATDDSCVVLYGVIRDCAYRIRLHAEREKQRHIDSGEWNNCECGHDHKREGA
ncbi:MAG: hypothetical protein JXR97_00970 [Planctomycetes bacterium]|nr:hypothetical protein [Planctomycetota bacterium]